jgi:hypothetical protein
MSVQAKHAEIEWRRMADTETYYPLRDGPRMQKSWWCVSRMAKHLPAEDVWLAGWLMELRRKTTSPHTAEIGERVQASSRDHTQKLTHRLKLYAGYQSAVLIGVGRDAYSCLEAITDGVDHDTLASRVGYSPKSKRSLIRLVQLTLEEAQAHHQTRAQTRAA